MANERTSSSSSLSEGGTPTVTVGMGSEDAGKKTRNASATAWTKELEPHAIAKTFERRYVTIEGVEYDVTDFKHPGGSVIYYMLSNTGADATEAFKEFHYRSKKPFVTKRNRPRSHSLCSDGAADGRRPRRGGEDEGRAG